jgi:hypothetical protein
MPEVAVRPSLALAGLLDDGGPPLERFRARRAPRDVAHARHFRRRQLQRVMFVIVPSAQKDGVAAAAALGHPHDVDEEMEAFLRLRRQQLDVREVGEIKRSNCGFHGPRLLDLGLFACRDQRGVFECGK